MLCPNCNQSVGFPPPPYCPNCGRPFRTPKPWFFLLLFIVVGVPAAIIGGCSAYVAIDFAMGPVKSGLPITMIALLVALVGFFVFLVTLLWYIKAGRP